jgi:tRNA (guanine-N7-)-methyltransferase
VRRAGRTTRAQRRALETGWEQLGLPAGFPLELDQVFGRRASRILEIGFGMGDVLTEAATSRPDVDFLGLEVHEPGLGKVLAAAAARGLANLRLLRGDAAEVLPSTFAAASLDEVWVLFPDPWPKARHHKRRLVQPVFGAELARVLRPGGLLRLATDWEDYGAHMLAVLDAVPALENTAGAGHFGAPGSPRGESRFERRGRALGHPILELGYRRTGSGRP